MKKVKRPKDRFFDKQSARGEALTFDDVRLRTGYCGFRPEELSFETMLSRRVPLKIPVVASPMDSVTGWEMATAMAKLGGFGVIHFNFPTAKDQAREARRVWHHLNGRIEQPVTVRDTDSIEKVEAMQNERNLTFHSFPALDEADRLGGLLTRNDFDFCEDKSKLVRDVMTPRAELITAPFETTVGQAYDIMRRNKKKILPLVDGAMKLIGMYVFSDVQRIVTGSSSLYNLDANGHLRCGAAVGILDDAFERIELLGRYVSAIVIDNAHGDFEDYIETLRQIKKKEWPFDVIVGNISEGESAKRLVDAGADGLRVGQGGGSICISRKQGGYGCPQVTAVYEVKKAIGNSGVPVCSDGGIVHAGDVPIAIGAGAHSVMVGKAIAATKESPGEIITREVEIITASGQKVRQVMQGKIYRGMGSAEAVRERAGSRGRYQADSPLFIPEGEKVFEPYKGEVFRPINHLLGGLRIGMLKVGARTIDEMIEKTNFWRITSAGLRESGAHDVIIVGDDESSYRRSGT